MKQHTFPKRAWDRLHSGNGTTRIMTAQHLITRGRYTLDAGGQVVSGAVWCEFRNQHTKEILARGILRVLRAERGPHVSFDHDGGATEYL